MTMSWFMVLVFLIWAAIVAWRVWGFVQKLRGKGVTLTQVMEGIRNAKVTTHKSMPLVKPVPISTIRVFGFIGAAILAGGLWFAGSTYDFVRTGTRVPGEVTRLITRTGSKGGRSYAPEVRFKTTAGADILFVSRLSTSYNLTPPAGSSIHVIYQESEPGRARIDRFVYLWMVPVVMSLFGAVFVFFAYLGYRRFHGGKSSPSNPLSPDDPTGGDYGIPPLIR